MDCRTQTGQGNKGLRLRELEELLLMVCYYCFLALGNGYQQLQGFDICKY